MAEIELPRDALRRMGRATSKHWVLLAASATLVSFAAGLAHMRGYLAALGFESLVFSLSPEHYFAIGAVALVGSALLIGALLLLVLPLPRKRIEDDGVDGGVRLGWALAAGGSFLVLIFIMTWHWLAPLRVFLPLKVPDPLESILILVGMLVVFTSGVYAVRHMRGQTATVYLVALVVVAAPAVANLMGKARAEALVEDVFHAPRVVVWRNETSSPEGYVVVHQEGDALYLVYVVDEQADPPAFRSTVLLISEVARIDFIPAGGSDAYAFPPKNATEA